MLYEVITVPQYPVEGRFLLLRQGAVPARIPQEAGRADRDHRQRAGQVMDEELEQALFLAGLFSA